MKTTYGWLCFLYLCFLCLSLALGALPVLAQEEAESVPTPELAQTEPIASPSAAPSLDPEAATRAYLDRLTPEERQRSDDYFEGGYWLKLWGLVYSLAVAWLLLFGGLSARMRDLAERFFRRKPLQTAAYSVQYLLLTFVLFFPLTLYQGFFREHHYDLATQGFGGWLRDQLVGLGVSVVMMTLLLIVLYGILRRAPRTWWIWGGGVMVVFLAFFMLIAPVYIDPLFNTYVPLADEAIKDPILSMARANGVPAEEVLQFDASRQTTRISANVSGFAGTMAIRLNDNLLERCSPEEIQAVMGHELGHYVLNHTYELLMEIGLVLVVGFAFLKWASGWSLARWGERWRVRSLGDVASLPLFVVLLAIYFFLATPAMNNIIRSNEAEADIFGLNAAREPEGFAEIALKLGEYRKLEPSVFEEWLLFDHPSGESRIRMAMEWKAEHLHETK